MQKILNEIDILFNHVFKYYDLEDKVKVKSQWNSLMADAIKPSKSDTHVDYGEKDYPISEDAESRRIALKWWNKKTFEEQFDIVSIYAKILNIDIVEMLPQSLTGRQIETIYTSLIHIS